MAHHRRHYLLSEICHNHCAAFRVFWLLYDLSAAT